MTLPLEKKPRWFTTELAATLFAAVPTLLTAVGGIVRLGGDSYGMALLGQVLIAIAQPAIFAGARN